MAVCAFLAFLSGKLASLCLLCCCCYQDCSALAGESFEKHLGSTTGVESTKPRENIITTKRTEIEVLPFWQPHEQKRISWIG
ncbi:uncharacterized protein UTRI_03555 [Ustilago trichophora]|uniref:Secreted protein n=1 Tax=Ustilago trichophora TaxID=86804 RepID=A0A5C3E3U7_9BASI|nr:uncharacterized protein UTRI_03555 [Ustilago trichophora]